jgi:hypothetical protein
MHRSSESVAAIATALAKAQTELSNPEKAMVGTFYNNRSDSPQSFRYASLSSGLDIIRKTLGGQQIAIAQTTDIDRTNGTVTAIDDRLVAPFKVAHAIAVMIVENHRVLGTVVAVVIIYRVAVFMENW